MLSFRFLKDWVLTGVRGYTEHSAGRLAAGISYYAVFSIFPLLIFIVAIAGIFLDESAQESIVDAIMDWLPLSEDGGRSEVEAAVHAIADANAAALGLVGLIGMFWAASGMFGAVRYALNIIYEEQGHTRPYVQAKLIDLSMVLGVGLFFAASTFVSTALRIVRVRAEDLDSTGEFIQELDRFWLFLTYGVPFIFSFVAFWIVYTVVPSRNSTITGSIPGAFIAALAFEIVKNLFGFYVERFTDFDVIFGSLTAAAIFLFWVYINSQILLIGAEIGRAFNMVPRTMVKQGRLEGMGEPLTSKAWRTVRGLFIRDPEAGKR